MPAVLLAQTRSSIADLYAWCDEGSLFVILDQCDLSVIHERIGQLDPERAVSLFRETPDDRYEQIAPYLALVDRDLVDWIVTTLSEESWGCFVVSHEPMEQLRRHFKNFLRITSPSAEKWFFRFYDPRVLSSFLPTCTESELREFYGPVDAFGVHRPGGESIRLIARAKDTDGRSVAAPTTGPDHSNVEATGSVTPAEARPFTIKVRF